MPYIVTLLFRQQITKALIRLRTCAGWSPHLFFTSNSEEAFPVCFSDKHLVTSSPDNQLSYLQMEKEVFKILEHLPYYTFDPRALKMENFGFSWV